MLVSILLLHSVIFLYSIFSVLTLNDSAHHFVFPQSVQNTTDEIVLLSHSYWYIYPMIMFPPHLHQTFFFQGFPQSRYGLCRYDVAVPFWFNNVLYTIRISVSALICHHSDSPSEITGFSAILSPF